VTASAECAPITGIWVRAPSGVQECLVVVGVKGMGKDPLKFKPFCLFSYKEAPKVTDKSDRVPPCLRLSASCSHDQTLLLVNGG